MWTIPVLFLCTGVWTAFSHAKALLQARPRQHNPQHFPNTHTGSGPFCTSDPHGCAQQKPARSSPVPAGRRQRTSGPVLTLCNRHGLRPVPGLSPDKIAREGGQLDAHRTPCRTGGPRPRSFARAASTELRMQYCSIYGIAAASWRHAGWRYVQAGTGPRNARSGAHAAADTRAAIRVNRPASTSGRPRTDEPPHRGPAKPGMPAPGLPDLVAITGQFHCPLTRGKGHSPVKACTSVVWLPVWLPNGRKGAGIRVLSFITSMNRTYGLQ